jgi:hypothetical protein
MNRISKLAIQVLAQSKRQTEKEIREWIFARNCDLSPALLKYLQQGTKPIVLDKLLSSSTKISGSYDEVIELDPESVVEFLETYMEVKYER